MLFSGLLYTATGYVLPLKVSKILFSSKVFFKGFGSIMASEGVLKNKKVGEGAGRGQNG